MHILRAWWEKSWFDPALTGHHYKVFCVCRFDTMAWKPSRHRRLKVAERANKKSWLGGSINFLDIKVSFEKYSPLGAAAGWQWQRPALGATPGDQGRGQPPLFNFVQNTHFIFNEVQKALQFNILKAPLLHPFPHIQEIHMWKLSL